MYMSYKWQTLTTCFITWPLLQWLHLKNKNNITWRKNGFRSARTPWLSKWKSITCPALAASANAIAPSSSDVSVLIPVSTQGAGFDIFNNFDILRECRTGMRLERLLRKSLWNCPIWLKSSDPLLWWRTNGHAYPILAKIACNVLALLSFFSLTSLHFGN